MEIGGVGIEAHPGHAVQRVHHEIGVGEHHALGSARRAARVEKAGKVVVAGSDILHRLVAVSPRSEVARRDREIVQPHDLSHRRRAALQRLQMVDMPVSTNSAAAPESFRMYSISGAASRVFTGTITAPIQGRAYISSR